MGEEEEEGSHAFWIGPRSEDLAKLIKTQDIECIKLYMKSNKDRPVRGTDVRAIFQAKLGGKVPWSERSLRLLTGCILCDRHICLARQMAVQLNKNIEILKHLLEWCKASRCESPKASLRGAEHIFQHAVNQRSSIIEWRYRFICYLMCSRRKLQNTPGLVDKTDPLLVFLAQRSTRRIFRNIAGYLDGTPITAPMRILREIAGKPIPEAPVQGVKRKREHP
tara:strand:+ start:75 stop:740 length:666 start_codon:yes stop_codon:yes gene_type:complete